MFGFFFLLVAAWAGYGIFHMLRSAERNRRYLAEGKEERPLQLDHLSLPLRRLAESTRMLRISLESPIRDIVEFRQGEFHQTAGEDLESLDNMLMNLSRELGDWVRSVELLPEVDRARLEDLGISADPIRRALDEEGGAFERRNLHVPGRPPLDRRLEHIRSELARFESALQLTSGPYR